jgi:hypothetical protein
MTATSTNRLAMASFSAAVLTLLSFCIGAAPIPLTGWVCYPVAILLGAAALLTGFRALRQLRSSGEKGRVLAVLGMWMGGLTILAVLCLTTLTIVILFYGAEAIHGIWPGFHL